MLKHVFDEYIGVVHMAAIYEDGSANTVCRAMLTRVWANAAIATTYYQTNDAPTCLRCIAAGKLPW